MKVKWILHNKKSQALLEEKKKQEADTGSEYRRKMSEHFGMSCRGIFVQYGNYVE